MLTLLPRRLERHLRVCQRGLTAEAAAAAIAQGRVTVGRCAGEPASVTTDAEQLIFPEEDCVMLDGVACIEAASDAGSDEAPAAGVAGWEPQRGRMYAGLAHQVHR